MLSLQKIRYSKQYTKTMQTNPIEEIIDELRVFNHERDWEQFHDGKNLALQLSIEASELNEAYLWKNAEDVDVEKVKEELADVFICAFMIADKYNLNVEEICKAKIKLNGEKYPVEKAKSTALKYNKLK